MIAYLFTWLFLPPAFAHVSTDETAQSQTNGNTQSVAHEHNPYDECLHGCSYCRLYRDYHYNRVCYCGSLEECNSRSSHTYLFLLIISSISTLILFILLWN